MKRLLFFALIAAAAWMAWKRGPSLFEKQPSHEVIVTNASRGGIERLRLSIAGRTFVAETLTAGARERFEFRVQSDTQFDAIWNWADRPGESRWSGGRVVRGPLTQTHRIRIDGDGGVVYFAEDRAAP